MIALIGVCDVLNVELSAAEADVQLQIIAGEEVRHILKIPTMDAITQAQNATRTLNLQYGKFEARPKIEAFAALWDKCVVKVEGYEGPVPIIHKDRAIRQVIEAIDQEVAPKHAAENF